MIWTAIKAALGPVGEIVNGWQKRVTARTENNLALDRAKVEAKIARLQSDQDHKQEWELTALETAGWKDEWILLLWSFPAILAFIGPGGAQAVANGFNVLSQTPEWYQVSWGVMVSSSYGIRKVWRHFGKGGRRK